MLEWFVLRTHFQQDKIADRNLTNQRIKTLFLQSRKEIRTKAGDLQIRIAPYFPGYLFAYADWNKTSGSILSTRGVKSVVGYLDGMSKPPSVPKADIAELQSRVEEIVFRKVINLSRPTKQIECGDLVKVLWGPFRDQVAPVQAIDGSRVDLLLSLFGHDITHTIHKKQIQVTAA